MFHQVGRWLCLAVFFAGTCLVTAHTGFENETDVRIYPDRMEVFVRTTYNFAWKILGSRAPNDIGEASQRISAPLLAGEAPGLFDVLSDGQAMTPRSADCKFELDEHVVFVLAYDRPDAWPLVLKAKFFGSFDPLTYGTVRVFDLSSDPFRRDIEPVAEDKIYHSKPAFTYDPRPTAEAPAEPVAVPSSPRPEKPKPRAFRGLVIAALLLVLIWSVRRVGFR